MSGGFTHFAVARYLNGVVEGLAGAIDIRPGSNMNVINLRSKGMFRVAILSPPPTFDATSVDPLSVRFGPAGAMAFKEQGRSQDTERDGDTDLVLHFRTPETGIAQGATSACLSGQTFAGSRSKDVAP